LSKTRVAVTTTQRHLVNRLRDNLDITHVLFERLYQYPSTAT